MADNRHPEPDADFNELLRAVRELSARVERLERRLDQELACRPPGAFSPETSPHELPPQPANSALEERIGSQWLNRIGVVAVLFGVAYLLRYVFVNGWVSAAAWIWLGVCAGVAIIAGSEWFRRHGYRVLSLSLKATGIGVSYLSLWAGLELYKLLSPSAAFSGLVALTILGAVMALRESAEFLGALALIAGFLTPLLISVPSDEAPLFFYLAILDVATAVLALRQGWWRLLVVGFSGTVVLSAVWYYQQYSRSELTPAMLAATLFFVIFCASAAWARTHLPGALVPPTISFLEVLNPAVYFLGLYMLLEPVSHNSLAIPALALSALYFAFSWRGEHAARRNGFITAYGGLGIAFVAVALAILLAADWLSLGWFLEAAVVMAIGFWKGLPWLRSGALLLLCAAIVKAFAYDVWQLSLGPRTLSFIGLGVLLLVMSFAYQRYGFSMISRNGNHTERRPG